MWRLALVLVVVLAVLGAAAAVAGSRPPPADLRTCANEGRSTSKLGPASDQDVLLGPVVFMRLGRLAYRPASLRFRRDRYGIKIPVILPVDTAVTLAVPAAHRTDLKLGYVHDRNRTRSAVRIESCPPRYSTGVYDPLGPASGFPGGVVLPGPRCVPIEAWLDGQAIPLRRTLSFWMGRCSRSATERAVERGIRTFVLAMKSGRMERFCDVLLPLAREQQGCGTTSADIGPALTTTIDRPSDVRLLWTQGRRATIEFPRFQGNRHFAHMAFVADAWRVAELSLGRPCDAELRCS